MRAVWISRHGGPEVLEVRTTADPEPGPGEVRVRVRAAGLNFADIMARTGLYPDAPKPPCVVGYEFAGEVDALGPGTAGPPTGARVVGLTRFGGHSELVCVPGKAAFLMAEGMTFEAAAAIPLNYLTAYHVLFRVAAVRPGERVLVHMAAGGVGIAALQLCRTIEGVVTYGTASAAKHEAIEAEGCQHPVDYRSADWETEVRRLTGGEGVDVVLDPLGGRDTRKGYRLLRPAGRLVMYGVANLLSGGRRSLGNLVVHGIRVVLPRFSPMEAMNDNRSVAGVNVAHLPDAMLAEEMAAVLGLFARGAIKPHIDSTFSFEQAAEAHRRVEERRNVGKVLLVP
ncbi:MAG TPA: medium chain dehydrogenase/reductase family protein [Anaeromyxobacter sp.]|nr:medium chain dehydrogenase/reductase family protein [Anaeromyxobacter sp.]